MRKNEKIVEGRPSRDIEARGFHIEVDGVNRGISVSVGGVLSILDFTEEAAVVKIRRGRLKIVGSELAVSVYENKTVEISGRLCRIEFL